MDPMREAVESFVLDVNSYLSIVSDYGKPNFRYFNFVLNKTGILHIFTSKIEIFGVPRIAAQFVDKALVALKNKFLSENSNLKRAALVYFICKVYFTDSVANCLKLRITSEEFEVFKNFHTQMQSLAEYDSVRMMLYQLFIEGFFKFTMKNKPLALDFGKPSAGIVEASGIGWDEVFTKQLTDEIAIIEGTDIVELKQINEIRREAAKSFKEIFPEQNYLDEALQDLESIKRMIQNPKESISLSKSTRKPKITKTKTQTLPKGKVKKEETEGFTVVQEVLAGCGISSETDDLNDSEDDRKFNQVIRSCTSLKALRKMGIIDCSSKKIKNSDKRKS